MSETRSRSGYAAGEEAALGGGSGPLVSQVYEQEACVEQSGGGGIATPTSVWLSQGGPALLCWQATASTQSAPAGLKMQPVLNNVTDSTQGSALFYNFDGLHLPLLARRALVQPLPKGESSINVYAGTSLRTDSTDTVNMALVDFGDMSAPPQVRLSTWGTARGTSSQYTSQVFSSSGGLLVISLACTGWSSQINQMIGAVLYLDGVPVAKPNIFSNWASCHMPMVGMDLVIPAKAGGHNLNLVAAGGTVVDYNDTWSLTVMELQGAAQATQILNNAPCPNQQGGQVIGGGSFTAGGGVQLICLNVSAYRTTPDPLLLQAHILVDGAPIGNAQLYATQEMLHLPLSGGDITPGQLPPGQHTVQVVAEDGTVTDYNDRISLTVLEFAH